MQRDELGMNFEMHVNYDPETVADLFDKLFRTYPSFQAGDGDEALRVYFEAVAPYKTHDIESAVASILSGSAPGMNANFAPPAPAVAAETRRQMNLRLDSEARRRQPRLPAPMIEHTPESRARIKAMADQLVADLAAVSMTEDAAAARRKTERWQKVNERFTPDMDEASMRKRLGYTVGDPDNEAA